MTTAEWENPWVDYWNTENIWSGSSLWRKQMEAFVRLSSEIMDFCQDDKVLDFGCGNGNFAEIAASRLGSVVCADVSEKYVEVCERKFVSTSNVSVARVKPDMSDISMLGTGFTKVICFSVMHYFADLDHVAAFIRGMQQICVLGAKMIIGDIGSKHRTLQDSLKALSFVLREGMAIAIEPMLNMGGWEALQLEDGWTVVTADGSMSAHFEDTIVITSNGPEVTTTL